MCLVRAGERRALRRRGLLVDLSERAGGFFGAEAGGTWSALVCDVPAGGNDVDALGPRGVRMGRGIVDAIEQYRQGKAETAPAKAGGGSAVVKRSVLLQKHLICNVRGYLPLVGGVCFRYVDEEEVGSFAVSREPRFEVARPATERRSGVTAKAEHDGAAGGTGKITRSHRRLVESVKGRQGNVGRGITYPYRRFPTVTFERERDHRALLWIGHALQHLTLAFERRHAFLALQLAFMIHPGIRDGWTVACR